MSENLDELSARIEWLIPHMMRTITRLSDLDPLFELSQAQIKLMRLLQSNPHSGGKLSEELGISSSAVTQLTDRLEALGFVQRHIDENDRRQKTISLTEHGLKAMEARRNRRVSQVRRALKQMSVEEISKLCEGLEAFAQACQEIDQLDRASGTLINQGMAWVTSDL